MNEEEEEYRSKKTNEVITKYLSFVKGVMDTNKLLPLLPLNFNMDNLQESKIIKVISNKLVRKVIKTMCKQAEKDESKKEKNDDIYNETKEVEINANGEVIDTDNE